ncbi:glycosyltransferase family 1 protein [Glonium stellatum]|uniref:Glycosyltransferase family 1 protein n=1 Tax=Glonium stellatum TaxID=574774 RepID=A0A8E2JX20_9PEZI|nr:glycosyltransferase family 1 protein [Glonium stellatum]
MPSTPDPPNPHEPSEAAPLPPGLVEQAVLAADANEEEEGPLGERENDQSREPERTKPEGSGYESSYRPSNTRAGINRMSSADEHYGFNASQVNLPAAQENDAPPAYSETLGQIANETDGFGTNASVADDGRVNIRINQKSRRFSQILVPTLQSQIAQVQSEPAPPPPYIPPSLGGHSDQEPPPPLNVVIHVVGSRGDVQPFVALGKVLKETYGHRVRLATHPTFKDFVTENGLEFFSIGGDPSELMAFMVKNPGLMPGFDTLRSGDVGKRRRGIAEIVKGCWRSCIETGDGLGVESSRQNVVEWMGAVDGSESPEPMHKPFVADVIIANPPSFAHIHCAEKLGIPLHMMFTMPWSPTQSFPHPLANIQSSNADASLSNFMSYALVDMLTWQGLGDVINRFRKESLGLEPVSLMWAPGMLARLKIPYTYCWSPALIPKPKDWGHHISISGFYFLSLASNYHPDPELAAFLAAGPAPVYIGFGSIVVDDPNAMTTLIFDAVRKTGQRALVSKGWGGFGADELGIPEGVYMLGNVPHDWLFKHVSCVVHHGGAGTTAAGIACGRPTVVVPFFGDQPFWGAMVAKAGAGPAPIPYKQLTSDSLAEAIMEALKPTSLERAQELSEMISQEKGSDKGAQSFHQMLKVDQLRCSLAPRRAAVWRVRRTDVRLSALAATVLAQEGELNFGELKMYRPCEYETDDGPWDPVTGGASAIVGTVTTMMMGIADFPVETLKRLNIHPDSRRSTIGSEASSSNGDGSIRSSVPTPSRENSLFSRPNGASTLPGVSTPATTTDSTSGNLPPSSPGADPSTGTGATSPRNSFMAQAMRAQTQVSRSRSRGRSPCRFCPLNRSGSCHHHGRSASHDGRTESEAGSGFTFETASHTGRGISRIVGAGLKSPMDFSINVAKGFHNAPRLYGEEVRKVDKVTDLQSGLKTAAKEFGIGFYEGMTGLVKDPYQGAKKEGAGGFLKGIGKGIAGVPIKTMAGVWAVPGYTFKGIYQELQKEKGATVQNYIIAARMAQGYDDLQFCTPSERADIISRWRCVKVNVKRKKNPGEEQLEALHTLLKEHREKRQAKWAKRKATVGLLKRKTTPMYPPAMSDNSSYSDLMVSQEELTRPTSGGQPRSPPPLSPSPSGLPELPELAHARTYPQPHAAAQELEAHRDSELEDAIRLSVSQAGAEGPPDEDELIERAIRASIAELERPAAADEDEDAALQRAMRASIAEASASGATEEEKRVLEEVLRKSVLETRRQHGTDSEWEGSSVDTEDDEEVRRVIEASKAQHAGAGAQQSAEEEEVLRRAMEESHQEERRRAEEEQKQRTEEEIVMEYVKKQSLAEEEHRMRMLGRKTEAERIVGESSGSGGGAA